MSDSPRSKLLEYCKDGSLDPIDVLENVLFNYMSKDDADDFVESDYDIYSEDEEYDDIDDE